MNNVLDSIMNIDATIHDVDSCVVESLTNLIEKNEMIQEWSDGDLSGLFMESMMWFTEAASKDKDEITKWMASKGYWYEGDNSNKKKKCNRMYQFLKQHDFRPSDETYKSEISDGNGGKKRIKLVIDPKLEKDDIDFMKRIKRDENEGIYVTSGEKTRRNDIKDKQSYLNEVKRGENAHFSHKTGGETHIAVGSDLLKGKQRYSQQTLKHEEGHADSFDGNKSRNKDLPSDHPASKAIAEHKAAGKYVNSHDDSTEELMADLYSAMHSSIRTKNWGKNKTTRSVTAYDIKSRYIKNAGASDKAIGEYINEIKKFYDVTREDVRNRLDLAIDSVKKQITNDSEDKQFAYDYFLSSLESVMYSNHSLFDGEHRGSFSVSGLGDNNGADIARYKKQLKAIDQELKRRKNLYDDIISIFKKRGINNADEIKSYAFKGIKEENSSDANFKDLLKYIYLDSSNMAGVIEAIEGEMRAIALRKSYWAGNVQRYMNKAKSAPTEVNRIHRAAKDAIDEIWKTGDVSKNTKNKILGEMMQWVNESEKHKTNVERISREWKESAELREKFAQTAIKEYFEELSNDYYFAD